MTDKPSEWAMERAAQTWDNLSAFAGSRLIVKAIAEALDAAVAERGGRTPCLPSVGRLSRNHEGRHTGVEVTFFLSPDNFANAPPWLREIAEALWEARPTPALRALMAKPMPWDLIDKRTGKPKSRS